MTLFRKKFPSFLEGLHELMQVCYSARQSLSHNLGRSPASEEEAVSALAINAVCDRPTGNGVDWARCSLSVTATDVLYRTTGGLEFGWSPLLGGGQTDIFDGSFEFLIIYPGCVPAPPHSTLRKSCAEAGWEVVEPLEQSEG